MNSLDISINSPENVSLKLQELWNDFSKDKYTQLLFYKHLPESLTFQQVEDFLKDEWIIDIEPKIAVLSRLVEVPFKEIEGFLKTESIDEHVRAALAWRVEGVWFKEIEGFLKTESIDEHVRAALAWRVEEVSFKEVEEFLKTKSIDEEVRAALAWRVDAVGFKEVEEFLKTKNINWYVRITLAWRVDEVRFKEAEEFLRTENIYRQVREKIAWRVEEVSFKEAEEFLKSEDINWYVRITLAWRVDEVRFKEAEEFLRTENIYRQVREKIAWRVEEVSFKEAEEFLKSENINSSVRAALAWRVEGVWFKEIEGFLKTESIDVHVRAALAWRVQVVLFKEVGEFLNSEEIHLKIRTALANRLKLEGSIWSIWDYMEQSKDNKAQAYNRYQCRQIWVDEKYAPKDRSLVLYCREYQWFHESHFWFIAQLLKEYIDQQKSCIWNSFKIMTRSWVLDTVGGIQVEKFTKWTQFRADSSVFSDTLHMSHGTPETTPWTHSIIGEAIDSDPYKRDMLKNISYTHLGLLYYWWENRRRARYNTWDTWFWFPLQRAEVIARTLLLTIRDTEREILEKIKSPWDRLWEILEDS